MSDLFKDVRRNVTISYDNTSNKRTGITGAIPSETSIPDDQFREITIM